MPRNAKIFILVLFMVLFTIGIVYTGCKYVYLYFIQSNTDVLDVFNEDVTNLVIEDEIVQAGAQPLVIEGEILLPLQVVSGYFDPDIHWDPSAQTVTVTTPDKLIRMTKGEHRALVNFEEKSLNIPVMEENNSVYIPIDFLKDIYKIEISFLKENNLVIIDRLGGVRQIARPVTEDAVVRSGMSRRHPIIRKLSMDPQKSQENSLRIFEEYDRWYKVRTSYGEIGYISKKHVAVTAVHVIQLPEEGQLPVWKPDDGKISLAWEQTYNGMPDLSGINIENGLDVLSPTGFELIDRTGGIKNYCKKEYIDWAHQKGFKVWPLINNGYRDTEMTHHFLANTWHRDNLIRQVAGYAEEYNFDGISIDFENVNLADKDALTQFVREMSAVLRSKGLTVSMAVGVPDGSENYSLCYDFKRLGEAVDYLALMTYDQHWSSSPVAGSVAQLDWVEQKLQRTLEMVRAEKLLLGLPFYVRVWKEQDSGTGAITLTSVDITMKRALELIREKAAELTWDAESGQYFVEYYDDNGIYSKMWLEEEKSINLKTSLVQKYKLAGTAAWTMSYATDSIWEVLNTNLKEIDNYFEWLAYNNDSNN